VAIAIALHYSIALNVRKVLKVDDRNSARERLFSVHPGHAGQKTEDPFSGKRTFQLNSFQIS
jgi:hypothetical protein